ncbi:MAG: YggU family protein [Gammaproteobacteria bacterium]|nr:YggU family protein [Gammaproteobacteria bacterium]
MKYFQWQDGDLLLNIKVQPRASKDELAEILGDSLKVRITAPPVDGAANKHLIAFLAKIFKVSKSQVTLISGETGREKRLRVQAPKQWPEMFDKDS